MSKTKGEVLLAKLRHHVSGAIERGEAQAIVGIEAESPGCDATTEHRTKAVTFTATTGRADSGEWNNVVLASFARQLERELNWEAANRKLQNTRLAAAEALEEALVWIRDVVKNRTDGSMWQSMLLDKARSALAQWEEAKK